VSLPGSTEFIANKRSHFAAFENEVSPACFIQPSSSKEVANIIKYIQASTAHGHSGIQVAIRSGEDTVWAGSANIKNCITIDLSNLNMIKLNQENNVASIGVG
jgi:FAD/FMN-containing dehydrogenase